MQKGGSFEPGRSAWRLGWSVLSAMLSPQQESVVPPKSERTTEHERLASDAKRETNWKRWGAYKCIVNIGPTQILALRPCGLC